MLKQFGHNSSAIGKAHRFRQGVCSAGSARVRRGQCPPLSDYIRRMVAQRYPDEQGSFNEDWARCWNILCAVAVTSLWIRRVQRIFRGECVTAREGAMSFWAEAVRQLEAVARREYRKVGTVVRGAKLYACLEILTQTPSKVAVTHDTCPDEALRSTNPAFLTWLRTYQLSCT